MLFSSAVPVDTRLVDGLVTLVLEKCDVPLTYCSLIDAGFVEESAFLGEYHTVDQTGQSGMYLHHQLIIYCYTMI